MGKTCGSSSKVDKIERPKKEGTKKSSILPSLIDTVKFKSRKRIDRDESGKPNKKTIKDFYKFTDADRLGKEDAGAFGSVFKATRIASNTIVAIKLVKKSLVEESNLNLHLME